MLKRKIFFVLLCSMVCICSLHARQDSTGAEHPARDTTKTDSTTFARHSVYGELLGNGAIGTLNYDFRLWKFLSFRVGIPVIMLNALIGSDDHMLELGLGASGYHDADVGGGSTSRDHSYWTSTIAYRYQNLGGGIFIKLAITPIFYDMGVKSLTIKVNRTFTMTLWGGIALGFTF